jgi:hypothetical protein
VNQSVFFEKAYRFLEKGAQDKPTPKELARLVRRKMPFSGCYNSENHKQKTLKITLVVICITCFFVHIH